MMMKMQQSHLPKSTCDSSEPEVLEPVIKRLKRDIIPEEISLNSNTHVAVHGDELEPQRSEVAALSKRQVKKIAKKEKWLQTKKLKREREREKKKQKKVEARELNLKSGPSRKELKRCTMANSNCKTRVVIDLSFDDYMNDRDLGKCTKQILRCYSLNRRSPNPLQFYVTSFNGRSKADMDKHEGYGNWDVHFKSEKFDQIFPKDAVVYLTSESENVIQELQDDKVYIIGGLVDHNTHKGLCHKIAIQEGFSHGKLPIDEYMEMKTRKVLTIDHVFEIIVNVCQGLSWKEAFQKVIPARKGAVPKDNLDFSDTL